MITNKHAVTMDTIVRQMWSSIYNLEVSCSSSVISHPSFHQSKPSSRIYTSEFLRNETVNQVENLLQLQRILLKKIDLCKKMFGFHFIEQYRLYMNGRALLNLQRSIQRCREKTSLHLVHAGLYGLFCKLEDSYRSKHELLTFHKVESPQNGPKLFINEIMKCKTSFKHVEFT